MKKILYVILVPALFTGYIVPSEDWGSSESWAKKLEQAREGQFQKEYEQQQKRREEIQQHHQIEYEEQQETKRRQAEVQKLSKASGYIANIINDVDQLIYIFENDPSTHMLNKEAITPLKLFSQKIKETMNNPYQEENLHILIMYKLQYIISEAKELVVYNSNDPYVMSLLNNILSLGQDLLENVYY